MPRFLFPLLAALCLFAANARSAVVISEFMAANTNTNIVDEDGNHEDWLELQNNGATTVSLNGWYLTDDATDLRKWQFPATSPTVSLAPGARLLVWASGKNRKASASRLHTNFKLDSSGEYLALVQPDGLTVEHSYGPTFPPQATDVSYGISAGQQWNVLVGPTLNSQWKVKMPLEAADLTGPMSGWNTSAAYDTTNWASKGTTVSGGVPKGIGYDSSGTNGARGYLINYSGSPNGNVTAGTDLGMLGMYNTTSTGPDAFVGAPTLCMRATFSVADKTTVQAMRLNARFDDGFILYLNGTEILRQNAPASATWNAAAASDRTDSLSDTTVTFDLTNAQNFLVNGTNLLAIHAFNDAKNSTFFLMTPDIQTQVGGTWGTVVGPSLNSSWKVKMPQSATEFTRMNTWNTSASFNDANWASKSTTVASSIPKGIGYDTVGTRSGLINAQVRTASDLGLLGIYNTSSGTDAWPGVPTLCMRSTFTVADPSTIAQLRLNIRYDDGFVLYINGTEVLRQNAPGTVAYNSASAADREDDQSESYETFTLSGAASNLVAGTNFVAIHALNESKTGGHFVMTPSLEAYQTVNGASSGTVGYLTSATPGTANTTASTTIGPDISKVTDAPAQPVGGTGSAPILVTAKLKATLNAVSSVTCYYIVNFGSEVALAMKDDGTGGDLVAADKIYSCQVPTTALAPGQFLRWRVVAIDASGNQSTDPKYTDPFDNDQYHGTMAQTGIVSSLPLLYWFHNSASTNVFASTEAGFRSSFYFQLPGQATGKYYDNIRVNLHGQSTAGFSKKSQNLNFNADNRFTWRIGEKDVSSINILSNYADKSHIRNPLAWDTWNATKHPSHWCQQVRVQQVTTGNLNSGISAQFLGVMDMVEDGNSDFLDRWGLDSNGALYKVYNSLQDVTQNSSTNGAGVEKKTREWENFSDLQALVTAMDTAKTVSARRQWLYDNVDVPGLINYLAVHALILNNDFGHKNYYIYRDTLGTGEWTLLPWDQDLSFGHTWTSAQNYFDDDIDSARGVFIGAASGNRLMNIITTTGATELAQMLQRRMRTLMDQFYGPPASPSSYLVNRANAFLDLIDPPGATAPSDAERDFQKWGFWVDGSSASIAYTDSRANDHRARAAATRIKDTNNTAIYPGANPYAAFGSTANVCTSLQPFIPGRRDYLYNQNPTVNGQAIPAAQSALPNLIIENVTFNPGTAGQDGEYFTIRNPNTTAIDLSGWKLTGAVDYTFRPGTIIPAQGTSTSDGTSASYVNQIVVAKKPATFRARTVSPKGNEYRLVVGGYSGQLSARGETIELRDASNILIASTTYTGSPTVSQQALRVTELNFSPKAPTASESAALPGVKASDFEFIELTNTGATTLDLSGASFGNGISFTFPSGFTLAAGARTLLVSNTAAFTLRYGSGLPVAGQFEGNLNNGGEQIQLLDSVGEVVLEFSYDPTWFPLADGGGYSLVTRDAVPNYTVYGTPAGWALSAQQGGTPGAADTSFSSEFTGWKHDHFTTTEETDALTSGLDADPDQDGLSNFGEYTFARDPRANDAVVSPTLTAVMVGNTSYLAVTFNRPKNAQDVDYMLEASTALGSGWSSTAFTIDSTQNLGNGTERVTFRDNTPAGSGQRFLRVRATKR